LSNKTSKSRNKQNVAEKALAKKPDFPVVGVGASAGGLEVIKTLLEDLPSDTGMAFVIIQHLASGQLSMLTEILSRSTSMPVCKVEDGMTVQENKIYVIPPDENMVIKDNELKLYPLGAEKKPIDVFFASLAVEKKERAIGVILSGTGNDGTEGLKVIKAEGGITIVQAPETAQYQGMPQSAIFADTAYFILPPHTIAKEIVRVAMHPQVVSAKVVFAESKFVKKDYNKVIFTMLKTAFGVDFTHYKDSTINRRIARRMVVNQKEALKSYVDFLRANPKELQALFDDMLIGVTNFFREPETFDLIKAKVFPQILRMRVNNSPIRIWVPGCSTGEEVYSIAIALQEFLEEQNVTDRLMQIFGTDINEKNIERSRQGVYQKNIETHVSAERLHKFFSKYNGNYQIAKYIRDMCVFAKQDITKDPPFSNVDMVCCRNLLIYFDTYLQERVIPILHYALKPSGFLVLGESESVGRFTDLFTSMENKSSVFIKKRAEIRAIWGFETFELSSKLSKIPKIEKKEPLAILKDEVDNIVMSRFVPAMMLVNSNLDILIFRGYMAPYILPESGVASLNINKIIREELKIEIQSGIYRAKKEGKHVTIEDVKFKTNGNTKIVNIDVTPVTTKAINETFYLVLFREQTEPKKGSIVLTSSQTEKEAITKDLKIKELRDELDSTKQSLQIIIEEQEGTSEELRAALEEDQSSNEELQSTNEELETAKEELQSTNEELKTLNDELKTRNIDLTRANDDLSNIIKNIDVALLIVDCNLKIRLFTPQSQEVLGIIPSDVGRPLANIRLNIPVNQLQKILNDVMVKLTFVNMDIQGNNSRWYQLHVRPYITEGKRIDGTVIAFIDIDDIKKAQENLTMEKEKYRTLAENSPEIIARFNRKLEFLYLSPSAEEIMGVTQEEAQSKTSDKIEALKPISSQLNKAVTSTLKTEKLAFGDFELKTADVSRVFKYSIAPELVNGKAESAICVLTDITELKKLERSLREHTEHLEDLVKEKTVDLQKAERLAGIGETAGMVGHDIRNPLQTITNSVFLATEELKTLPDNTAKTSIKDNLEQIEHQSEYINKIVLDLQDYAKHLCPETRLENIQTIIKDTLAIIKIPENIKVTTRIPLDLPKAKTDQSYLKRTLMNLITNSIQAMPKGGNLTVSAQTNDKKILLSVQDTGNGIPKEHREKIFKPLFTSKSKGQGFGLAVCKRLMEAQESTITFSSQEGKGTTFTITLPTT
jgi:two-component system, chemotaxis family, CheB/CheR fusion protein